MARASWPSQGKRVLRRSRIYWGASGWKIFPMHLPSRRRLAEAAPCLRHDFWNCARWPSRAAGNCIRQRSARPRLLKRKAPALRRKRRLPWEPTPSAFANSSAGEKWPTSVPFQGNDAEEPHSYSFIRGQNPAIVPAAIKSVQSPIVHSALESVLSPLVTAASNSRWLTLIVLRSAWSNSSKA